MSCWCCPKWFTPSDPSFWAASFLTTGTLLFLIGQAGIVTDAWTILLVVSAGFFLLGTAFYWLAVLTRMRVKWQRAQEGTWRGSEMEEEPQKGRPDNINNAEEQQNQ